jgi:uncharacterized membrane protein YidH (DUF202 family)
VTEHDRAERGSDIDAAVSAHHYRALLANERTFLGWQGLALSLIVWSIAVQSFTAADASRLWWVFAAVLALLGVVTAGRGLRRWRRLDRSFRCVSLCDEKAITPI